MERWTDADRGYKIEICRGRGELAAARVGRHVYVVAGRCGSVEAE